MRIAQRLQGMPSLEILPPDMLLTVEEAAAYLDIAPSTLEKWRKPGNYKTPRSEGPPLITLHDGPKAPVRYIVSDLRDWIEGRRKRQTNQGETPARVA